MSLRSDLTAERGTTSFLEVVDQRSGAVRAAGHLTEQGADLLRGVVLALRGRGHDGITLDLEGVRTVDDAGLHALRALQADIAAGGGDLVLVHAPDAAGAPVARTLATVTAAGARW